MGYQATFKPIKTTKNYVQIDQLLTRKLHKKPSLSYQELKKFMKSTSRNLIPSYNQLRTLIIKQQIKTKIPVLLQKT